MEIYILRDGKEIGPFSEETTQALLKQGSVFIHDLAWQPGMPQWIPLHTVLYPAPSGAAPAKPPPPVALPVEGMPVPVIDCEPATPKQKAFLTYMGVQFPADVSKEQAALLVNDTLENPGDSGRLTRWNEERLRLHPELFQAEIQARKDNRANHFHQVTQEEGANVVEDVTKAHCQVLVGFLDVHHPRWDASQHQATWDYFFPAIAEKFPQLVKKEWRGKLKYPEGPKVAPELARRSAVAKPKPAGFPMAAVVRGIVVGLGILIILYAGYTAATKKPSAAKTAAAGSTNARETAGAEAPVAADATKTGGTTVDLEKLLAQMPPQTSGDPTTPTTQPAPGAPMTGNPAAPGSTPEVPSTSVTSSPPLFDPNATASLSPSAPPALVDPTAAQPRTTVVITKPTEVQLRFGRAKLLPGTVVKFVGLEGGVLRVRYGTDVVAVPIASTDFSDAPAVTPTAPAPAPAVPVAPVVSPTPAPTAATPPPRPSLFD